MTNDINELLPIVREKNIEHTKKCLEAGIKLVTTGTYRTFEEQNEKWQQGRDATGHIIGPVVTMAKGGQSLHNWRVAYDVCPEVNGVLEWNNDILWKEIAKIGVSCGLEAGANWISFPDRPHFQYTLGYTWQDFLAGKVDLTKFNVEPKTTMEEEIKTFVPVGEVSHDNGVKRVLVNKATGIEHPVMATLFGEQVVTFTTDIGDIVFSNVGDSGDLLNDLYTVKEI
jgi:peptidoglycan LD-endopeptidase CwlK